MIQSNRAVEPLLSCGRSICLGMAGFPDLVRLKKLLNRSKKVSFVVTPCMAAGVWRLNDCRSPAGLTSDEEGRFSGLVSREVVSLSGSSCFSGDWMSVERGTSSGPVGGGLVCSSRSSCFSGDRISAEGSTSSGLVGGGSVRPARITCFPGDWVSAESGRFSGPINGGLVRRPRRRKTSVKTTAAAMITPIKSSHCAVAIIQPSFALEGGLLIRILQFDY